MFPDASRQLAPSRLPSIFILLISGDNSTTATLCVTVQHPYSGFGIMSRFCLTICLSRILRTVSFMSTVLPSPRPGCYRWVSICSTCSGAVIATAFAAVTVLNAILGILQPLPACNLHMCYVD